MSIWLIHFFFQFIFVLLSMLCVFVCVCVQPCLISTACTVLKMQKSIIKYDSETPNLTPLFSRTRDCKVNGRRVLLIAGEVSVSR